MQQQKIKNFRRWQDAHASLYGKLLLKKGLDEFGTANNLIDLKLNKYNKPYFERGNIGFNITHSGNFVACILTDETINIGIDAEEIKSIEINDFIDCWNQTERDDIYNNGLEMFYNYWTCKEAVTKADGKGLGIAFKDITTDREHARLQDKVYYLKNVSILPNLSINIASPSIIEKIRVCNVSVTDFL